MKRWTNVSMVVAGAIVFTLAGTLTPTGRAAADNVRPVEVVTTRTPFQASFAFSLSPEVGYDTDQVIVPAGKLLVIEQFTVSAGVPTGTIVRMRVSTIAEGTYGLHIVGLPATQVMDPQFDTVNAAIPVKLYADPGTTVGLLFDALRNLPQGFGADGEGTISGYLVDCPPGSACL